MTDPLSIDETPTKRINKSGGKRISKAPLAIMLIVAMVFLGVMATAMHRRGVKENANMANVEITVSQSPIRYAGSGEIKTPVVKPPPSISSKEEKEKEREYNRLTDELKQAKIVEKKAAEDLHNKALLEKQKRAYERYLSGVSAGTSTGGGKNKERKGVNKVSANQVKLSRIEEIKQKMAQLKAGGLSGSSAVASATSAGTMGDLLSNSVKSLQKLGSGGAGGGDQNLQEQKNEYFYKEFNKDAYNYHEFPKVVETYQHVLKEGDILDGVMISGINTDLPGRMIAQIGKPVYDTETGLIELIPQGAKLSGQYSSIVAYGQNGVAVAWTRLIYPNGESINLGNMAGSDSQGYSGFRDLVDNHYLRIFGSAVMMSAITAGMNLSVDADPSAATKDPSAEIISALTQQLGQVGLEMIRRNMNIQPTVEIRPGYKFKIIVTKDMVLPPQNVRLAKEVKS